MLHSLVLVYEIVIFLSVLDHCCVSFEITEEKKEEKKEESEESDEDMGFGKWSLSQ